MALDQNAGKKKAVGLARNLYPTSAVEAPMEIAAPITSASMTVSEALELKTAPLAASSASLSKSTPQFAEANYAITAKSQNRIRKVSFMIDPALEKRFRTARLKAGFEKLEDAYNEALKKFCELSEKGKIDNF